MKIRIDELKNSICTVFEDNAAEYVECAIDSYDETIEIMDRCPWVFDMLEMISLFISRYIGKVIVISYRTPMVVRGCSTGNRVILCLLLSKLDDAYLFTNSREKIWKCA